jgi:asparagine synthase (glutamine-hydrolysing)
VCGITGIFEYGTTRPVNREQLRRMNNTLRHRGPDEEGYYCATDIGLAMRRLAIIDRAGGQQPISNEDESVWIVFNGEIYNHPELRAELLKRNHQFNTRSDTEVILHLYEDYGAECVQRLDGMFAFAIYDGRPTAEGAGRLLLARDRLGKKPLYYADLGAALALRLRTQTAAARPAREPRVGFGGAQSLPLAPSRARAAQHLQSDSQAARRLRA